MSINNTISAELIRPADTIAYTGATANNPGDIISDSASSPTLLTFDLSTNTPLYQISPSGSITKLRVFTNSLNVAIANVQFRVHLYHTPITPLADNAMMNIIYANFTKKIGVIDTGTFRAGNTSSYAHNIITNLPFKINTSNAFFAQIETLSDFTPDSGQKFYVELNLSIN